MDIHAAAAALGGDKPRGNSINCPGPGHSPDDRSLRVTFTGDDFVVFSFCGDEFKECRDYVKSRLGLPSSWKPRPGSFDVSDIPARDDEKILKIALKTWGQTYPLVGTLAEKYLRSRACYIPWVADLRFHPRCYYDRDVYHPAMVGLFRDIVTDEPIGIHRTYLTENGEKIGRKMLGRHMGGAIKLCVDPDVTYGISVGEGIETTMSGIILGYGPAWAMGSAANIAAFPVVSGIETITVMLENDENDTSKKSAKAMAERLKPEGITISGRVPKVGKDLNDELRGMA